MGVCGWGGGLPVLSFGSLYCHTKQQVMTTDSRKKTTIPSVVHFTFILAVEGHVYSHLIQLPCTAQRACGVPQGPVRGPVSSRPVFGGKGCWRFVSDPDGPPLSGRVSRAAVIPPEVVGGGSASVAFERPLPDLSNPEFP